MSGRQINHNEQFWKWEWKNDSPKGQKFMTLTEQSVSKCDIVEQYLALDEWNEEQFNKQSDIKLRNKINAKKCRERKKIQTEIMARKLIDLEDENIRLKSEKICKWCRRPYDKLVMCSGSKTHNVQLNPKIHTKQLKHQRTPLEFEKPDLSLNSKYTGKIWIAIAILMLIIGIKIHGLDGDEHLKGLHTIQISKAQSEQWYTKLKDNHIDTNKNKSEDDYFTLNLGFKNEDTKQSANSESKGVSNNNVGHRIINIESEDKQMVSEDKESFKIHKDLIYSIQAQIADIGRYL